MSKVLVKYSEDYADEFQVSGFCVMEKSKWDAYVVAAANASVWPQCLYFGTNEGQQWESARQHLQGFKVIDVTDAEAEFLEKSFQGYGEKGHFLMFDEFPETPNELF